MTTTRTLTVVFTDLVGSTELYSELAEQSAVELILDHFATMHRLVEHHDGQVVKTLGDGVMATFPSAAAAIDCSIAMQRAAAHSARGNGNLLSIRVGISSGDVQRDETDLHGVAVIEASRLCSIATGGQVLMTDTTRLIAREHHNPVRVGPTQLKGLDQAREVWEVKWSPATPAQVRAVLCDDALLVREGIARVLTAKGITVIGQAGDATELEALVAEMHPDLAIVDVRMPPTFTREGVEAAMRIRRDHPDTAVLVLTQSPVPSHPADLRAASSSGIGYLLKERVSDLHDFAEIVRKVASGGTVFEGLDT